MAQEQLQTLFTLLFQSDHAELDFGIYRVINIKRSEAARFLTNELLPHVQEVFRDCQKELAGAIDTTTFENDVITHVTTFFRRYYREGDISANYRATGGGYVLPYDGEDVKLYWATHNQYYVKTAEYFRNYTITLPNGKDVHFKLVNADTGKDNNQLKERRFVLAEQQPLVEEDGALALRFEYRIVPTKCTQAELNAGIGARIRTIITSTPNLWATWSPLFEKRPTEKNPNRTLLEKHLADYTARNTFDYFIHKDLGGFLRRELDFYIKNEVMHLDDIESESAPRVEQYLAKIKAIRRIAHKIIDFLAQLENFQKKLWLKKKFVVETQYCVTLDRVPEELYPEIAANDAQREEWVVLFAIDELEGDLVTTGYSTPLTAAFFKANPYLVLDTRHFSEDFKRRLLASFDDLDEQCDGLLIHSENFQALNLLLERYRGQVKCIYIDPPYNTGNDRFIYKDRYQHSSWLAMMADRLALGAKLMRDDSALFVSIDGNERDRLKNLADVTLGWERYLNTFVWINNLKGRQISGRGAAGTHEYVLAYGGSEVGTFVAPVAKFTDVMPSIYKGFNYETHEDEAGSYVLKNELYNTNSKFNEDTRPNLVFNIHYNFTTGEIRFSEVDDEIDYDGFVKIPPKPNNDGIHKYHAWRWGKEKIQKDKSNLEFVRREDGVRIYTKVREFRTTVLKDVVSDISTSAGGEELSDLFKKTAFMDYPKPVLLVEVFASQAGELELIGDFFAGSGTTAHAVINLNREDGGRRKYILVEMGEYFDTVLVPRIKKVVYSKDWKDGKPVLRQGDGGMGRQGDTGMGRQGDTGMGRQGDTGMGRQGDTGMGRQGELLARSPGRQVSQSPHGGISHMFKYIRLESYEDTLNNLELRRTEVQQRLLEEHPAFREDYMLRYMLDVESRGSASLLNIDRFEDPFSYKLDIATGTAGETKPTVVDLVETFNYLIGLRVKTIDHIGGVRVVTGILGSGDGEQGENVLILWRNTKELDNDALDAWFRKQGYNTKDQEFDIIYVNGDNNLENLRRPDQTWKVRLIEEEFRRRMFDVADV